MAEGDDKQQKTEDATSKRIEEAREQGQLPLSREMATWTLFVAILAVVAWLGPTMAERMVLSLRVFLEIPHEISLEGPGLQTALGGVVQSIGLATAAVFGLLAAAMIAGTMVQTGFYMNPVKLQPKLEKILPTTGLKQLFSMNTLVEFAKNFVKMVIVGAIVVR